MVIKPHATTGIKRQIGNHILMVDGNRAILNVIGLNPFNTGIFAINFFEQCCTNNAIEIGPGNDSHHYLLKINYIKGLNLFSSPVGLTGKRK